WIPENTRGRALACSTGEELALLTWRFSQVEPGQEQRVHQRPLLALVLRVYLLLAEHTGNHADHTKGDRAESNRCTQRVERIDLRGDLRGVRGRGDRSGSRADGRGN